MVTYLSTLYSTVHVTVHDEISSAENLTLDQRWVRSQGVVNQIRNLITGPYAGQSEHHSALSALEESTRFERRGEGESGIQVWNRAHKIVAAWES